MVWTISCVEAPGEPPAGMWSGIFDDNLTSGEDFSLVCMMMSGWVVGLEQIDLNISAICVDHDEVGTRS